MDENKPVIRYINDPKTNALTAPELKLNRPKISFVKAAVYFIMHFVISELILVVVLLFKQELNLEKILSTQKYVFIMMLILFLITLRFTLIWVIKVYQRYARSEVRLRCHMTPSCSNYGILALKKFGAFIGSYKTIKRLLRCKGQEEIDYP